MLDIDVRHQFSTVPAKESSAEAAVEPLLLVRCDNAVAIQVDFWSPDSPTCLA